MANIVYKGKSGSGNSGIVTDNLVFSLNIKSINSSYPLIIPSSSDWNINSGEYSVDGFFFLNSSSGTSNLGSHIFYIGQGNYGSVYLALSKLRSGLGNELIVDFQSSNQRSVIETGTYFTPDTYVVRADAYNPVNQWTYFGISVSFSNMLMKFYRNGVFDVSVPITGTWDYQDTLHIGRLNYTVTAEILDGKLPIIRLYKGKCLTDAEFLQNFNVNKADFGL